MYFKYVNSSFMLLICIFASGQASGDTEKRSHNHGDIWIEHCWDLAGNHLLDPFCPQNIKNCSEVPEIENGSHDKTYSTLLGSKVSYACNNGYWLEGNEKIVCEEKEGANNPMWSKEPQCVLVCQEPPSIVHATFVRPAEPWIENTAVNYTCDAGYTLEGNSTIWCHNGTWSLPYPSCVPPLCPEIIEISNGYHDDTKTTRIGTVVIYHCDIGYEFKDTNRTICELSNSVAKWREPIPQCRKVRCVRPVTIHNAQIVQPGPQTNVSGVMPTAHIFTTLEPGNATLINETEVSSATTTEAPFTTTTDVPPFVDNTTMTNETETSNLTKPVDQTGSIDNTTMTNETNTSNITTPVDPTATMPNETDVNATVSTFDITVDIPTVKSPTAASPAFDDELVANETVYYVNDTVLYRCNEGYGFAGTTHWTSSKEVHEMTCLLNDTDADGSTGSGSKTYWSPLNTCVPVCPRPPELPCANHTNPDNTLEGAKVIYTPLPGYDLVGSVEIICNSTGHWSEVPVCRAGCGNAPEVEHGSHTPEPYDKTVNSTVNYVCDDNYFITGAEVIKCVLSTDTTYAHWETPPKCSTTCLPVPDLPNSFHTTPANLSPGTLVTYSCDTNFTLFGPENVTCLSNGSWSELPNCKKLCAEPPSINNAIMTIYTDHDTPYVKVTCKERHFLVGNDTLDCLHGEWQTPYPECKCEIKAVDIVFIIDGSGSLGNSSFRQILRFLNNMTERYPENTTRFGLVVFGSKVFHQFHLKDYINDIKGLQNRINNTAYPTGGTQTWEALKYARENMFQEANGMRPNVSHTAIVVTDGRSENFNETVNEAALLREAGVIIYTVGVGLLDQNELKLIASNDTYVFHVSNYEHIDDIQGPLAEVPCRDITAADETDPLVE